MTHPYKEMLCRFDGVWLQYKDHKYDTVGQVRVIAQGSFAVHWTGLLEGHPYSTTVCYSVYGADELFGKTFKIIDVEEFL